MTIWVLNAKRTFVKLPVVFDFSKTVRLQSSQTNDFATITRAVGWFRSDWLMIILIQTDRNYDFHSKSAK